MLEAGLARTYWKLLLSMHEVLGSVSSTTPQRQQQQPVNVPGVCLVGLYKMCHTVEVHVSVHKLYSPGRSIIGNDRSEARNL